MSDILTTIAELEKITDVLDLDYKPSKEEVDEGLKSEDWRIRYAFAKNLNITLTDEQIEKCLNDTRCEIRFIISIRDGIKFNSQQIIRGLMDKDESVQSAFVKYMMYNPNVELKLNDAQIESGLTNKNAAVRRLFSDFIGVKLTDEQIKRGALYPDPIVKNNIHVRENCAGNKTSLKPKI